MSIFDKIFPRASGYCHTTGLPDVTHSPVKAAGKRQYANAKPSRLLFSAPTSSADAELYSSHRALRDRSRMLRRDNPYAKRAKQLVVNHVIGPGMGVQAQVKNRRNRLLTDKNDAIESAWKTWSQAGRCHTGGALHFADLERAAMGEVFEAGECLIRLHARAFGDSTIPLGLELIESERIADDHEINPTSGYTVTMGIEHDDFGRPVAYYVHRFHPRQLRAQPHARPDEILRIPADQIIHLKITERWPQVRGEPWMHAAIGQVHQLGEYKDAALTAARIGASKVGFFESPEGDPMDIADGEEPDGTLSTSVQAGEFTQLPPGYKFSSWDPAYPTEAFEPFCRDNLRGISAAIGPCYESLSRDYSQSNYSSSRLAALDDRDLWRITQQWWIRLFREPLHRRWLHAAVFARAVDGIHAAEFLADPERYTAVKFKPRGWAWVDPTKEVKAYKEAELAGYTTKSDIIAATAGGLDLEDVLTTRRLELDMLADLDITTDTAPLPAVATPTTKPVPIDAVPDDPAPGRVVPIRGMP